MPSCNRIRIPLPWPAPESLLFKFVAHHFWDQVKRAEDPAHGMQADVEAGLRAEGLLKAEGPHAPLQQSKAAQPPIAPYLI